MRRLLSLAAAFVGLVGILAALPPAAAQQGQRPWVGLSLEAVTADAAKNAGMSEPRGALVTRVADEGSGKTAGILPGDIVIKYNNRDVNQPGDLARFVGEESVGREVPVTLIRNGSEVAVTMKVGAYVPDLLLRVMLAADIRDLQQQLADAQCYKGPVDSIPIRGQSPQ
jgi:S1-C subfamily serine protease